ncbi:N-acetylmuramoyl-L-alanine amidase AmiD precursor [Jannaschia seosinensis]|uniref:N-acetylmuramoyl-L-alanine amidase n=1 Tax=Jannaschia seosinensis TaxID=313367 RepID=A0A0M7B6A0_9RHOB|nr:N-acetylmuramoyl-L-alanine amidase [Jannaschia seosinensis]CUH07088.1 N-acetylmuramoyl-L-alanine amidase AmiD precursor [Jannaschia seosinensis]
MRITERPSPNHGPRRDGTTRPDLIVLHYTAMRGGPGPAIKRLCDPATEVSCHYVIGEAGDVTRLVPDHLRAWHAGAGRWRGRDDVNSRSIGIELSNDGASPFPAPQMDALETLLADLIARHGILPVNVIGHSDCAPGRKIDPGPRFDWCRLARGGLSVWPERRAGDPAAFHDHARSFGYDAAVSDETRLAAFRLRFRPGADGPPDATDAALAADLAARFPA